MTGARSLSHRHHDIARIAHIEQVREARFENLGAEALEFGAEVDRAASLGVAGERVDP